MPFLSSLPCKLDKNGENLLPFLPILGGRGRGMEGWIILCMKNPELLNSGFFMFKSSFLGHHFDM